jgi:hypothetical protein
VLSWEKPQTLRGLAFFRGRDEPGLGDFEVDVHVGTGDPRFIAGSLTHGWMRAPGAMALAARFRSMQIFAMGDTPPSRAIRIRCVGGVPRVSLGEIAVLCDLGNVPTAESTALTGVDRVPIAFEIPGPGKVTLQIRDEAGRVVSNPVAGVEFSGGRNLAYWDLDDVEGQPVLAPGRYRWHGLHVPGLKLDYQFTYYPTPLAHVAWQTEDRRGGWLADHEPPRTIARAGDRMWLGAFAEAGDSIVETDADANKLWGIDRIWVAIPHEICVDGDFYYGWCEGGWIGDNQAIIQIETRTKRSRKIFQRDMPKKEASREAMRASETKRGVTGFQVVSNLAFVSFGQLDVIQVFDLSQGQAGPWRGFGWDVAYKTIRYPQGR